LILEELVKISGGAGKAQTFDILVDGETAKQDVVGFSPLNGDVTFTAMEENNVISPKLLHTYDKGQYYPGLFTKLTVHDGHCVVYYKK
jgi:hypothetical protein